MRILVVLRSSVAVGLAAASLSSVLAAEPLGRLFFTPERRAALERQRQYNIQETRTIQGGNMRLDGIVKRSSGRTTIWVNGVPQNEHGDSAGVIAKLPAASAANAEISAGEDAPVRLRVGEAINRGTRESTDIVRDGRIIVTPVKQNH